MATNFFFNNFQSAQEQQLLQDLIVEAIRIYGHDIFYLPRNVRNFDRVYTADDLSSFTLALPCEMYIKSVDGFGGDGSFMSKFGLEIRDQVVFSVAQKTFSEEVGREVSIMRPREGDIIWFPLNSKPFQIKYVNKQEMFYQLGALQTWEMTCELFEYSNEDFDTGIAEIDAIQQRLSTNILDFNITDELGFYLMDESENYIVTEEYGIQHVVGTDEDNQIQIESDDFVDFSVRDPFSEGRI